MPPLSKPPDPPRLAPPRKPTAPHSPAPPREGSAPMPTTLSGLGRLLLPLPEGARLPLPPPLPRVDAPEPKSDPFPAEEAPTPVKRALPFRAGAVPAGTSQVARTFRNYEALTDENKRLVDGLVLALRATVDGGR